MTLPLPSISLVTVNRDYAQYLAATLDSVLDQQYPFLEYIVLDGGSTDGSVDLIRARADRLAHWSSGPDAGQVHALNAGLRRCTGDIVGWLNSDDLHLPHTLATIGRHFAENPSTDWICAPCETIDAQSCPIGLTPVSPDRSPVAFAEGLFFPQPSTFWRRRLHDSVGWLDPRLTLTFDQEFWTRLALAGARLEVLSTPLSQERLHDARKTANPGMQIVHERIYIAARHLAAFPAAPAARLRSVIRTHERRLLRSAYPDHSPTLAAWLDLVCRHPDLLRDRATWGLLARQLKHRKTGG